jgi:hypothetical protein
LRLRSVPLQTSLLRNVVSAWEEAMAITGQIRNRPFLHLGFEHSTYSGASNPNSRKGVRGAMEPRTEKTFTRIWEISGNRSAKDVMQKYQVLSNLFLVLSRVFQLLEIVGIIDLENENPTLPIRFAVD